MTKRVRTLAEIRADGKAEIEIEVRKKEVQENNVDSPKVVSSDSMKDLMDATARAFKLLLEVTKNIDESPYYYTRGQVGKIREARRNLVAQYAVIIGFSRTYDIKFDTIGKDLGREASQLREISAKNITSDYIKRANTKLLQIIQKPFTAALKRR